MIMQTVLGGLRLNIRCHILLQNPYTLEEVETRATLAETSLDNTQEESSLDFIEKFFVFCFYLPCLTFQIEKFVFQCKTALINM